LRPRGYSVYLALEAARAFTTMLVYTVLAVYLVTVIGMNPFELVLVGTVYEIAIFVFEVPTGIVADTVSRRLSVIVAFVIAGAAFAVMGLVADVGAILAASALLGLGLTFESGALEAWIADEEGGRDLERVYLRGSQAQYAGSLLGIGASVALGVWDLRAPIVAGSVAAAAIAVGLALFMPERGFRPHRDGEQARWRAFYATGAAGARAVRHSWVLLVIVVVSFFFGASSEALDRLWEAQFLLELGLPSEGDLEPIVWFGLLNAARLVLGFAAVGVLVRRIRPERPVRTVELLLAFDVALMAALLAFAFAGSFWIGVAAYLAARVARGLRMPLFTAWVNQNTESATRATVNSVVSQAGAIGEVGGGPGLGLLGTFASVRAALAASAALLLPALALYAHAIKRGGREQLA
jgi:MFS transporter, DHA3 family, tetracycline resistance protein